MKLCSACLMGIACRFRGDDKKNEKVLELAGHEVLIPVCPEQLAGLTTPRNSTELIGGKVVDREGNEMTEIFERGIEEAMKLVDIYDIKEAIMKQKSPTCGCGKIYDGTFTGNLIPGDGLFTQALKNRGVKVVSEEEL